jgi:uncharacterized protein (TIGR00369 family)
MNLDELAREVLRGQPFALLMGTELVSIEPGKVELSMPIRSELRQQHGFVHGGVVSYLADNAITFAGGSLLGGDAVTGGVQGKLRATSDRRRMIARADAIAPGKRLVVCRCDVFVVSGGGDARLCATAVGTVNRVEPRES